MAWQTIALFAYKEVLASTKMNQIRTNLNYFKSDVAVPTGNWGPTGAWVPTGNWGPTGAWTFTPGSAITPLTIDQNYNAKGLYIDSESIGTYGLIVEGQWGIHVEQIPQSGRALNIYRNVNAAGTEALVKFAEDHPSGTQNVLEIQNDGTGNGIRVDQIGAAFGLDVVSNYVGALDHIARFFHDGNSTNASGIYIWNGTDDNSGTNYHITFGDGNGTYVGSIHSSGGTVTYEGFTGGHPSSTKNNKEYPYGTVMILYKVEPNPLKKHFRQPKYILEPSKKEFDKKAFGIYAGRNEHKKNEHSIYALGDGHILVDKEGGNIEKGDYLTTSNKEGYAMKQNDDILHNYTIAKSSEDVDWKKEKKNTKLVACTYHVS